MQEIPDIDGMKFQDAARYQVGLYRAALMTAGLGPGRTLRVLGKLSTGARKSGEVIELSCCEAQGWGQTWRVRPSTPVHERGTRWHGLTSADLEHERPLAEQRTEIEAALTRPGPDGQPVTLAAWFGHDLAHEVARGLQAGGQPSLTLNVVDLQSILHGVDEAHPEFMYHSLSVGRMRWLVHSERLNPRRAISEAHVTRQVISSILGERTCTLPPGKYD